MLEFNCHLSPYTGKVSIWVGRGVDREISFFRNPHTGRVMTWDMWVQETAAAKGVSPETSWEWADDDFYELLHHAVVPNIPNAPGYDFDYAEWRPADNDY